MSHLRIVLDKCDTVLRESKYIKLLDRIMSQLIIVLDKCDTVLREIQLYFVRKYFIYDIFKM